MKQKEDINFGSSVIVTIIFAIMAIYTYVNNGNSAIMFPLVGVAVGVVMMIVTGLQEMKESEREEVQESVSRSSSYEAPERYYSLAKVRVQGIEDLDDFDKEFVEENLKKDMHIYLRNEFDNPKDCHALQVMHHNHKIGYIDKKKAEIVHSYLRNGDIGAIVVSKISSRDFKKIVELTIYYEDKNGDKSLPYYPFENRQISVVETDLWTGQEDWSEDWHMNIFTDELLYKYRELYDDTVDEKEKNDVDWQLSFWINSYLDGTCITRKGCNQYLNRLKTDCAKKVLMKRIESYLEHKDYHFADKELFSDDENEDAISSEATINPLNMVKQYDNTYEIAYRDSQGQNVHRTIKNANMNSFIAGVKFRDNYKEMLAKLSEGLEVLLKPEPDNPYDPDAIAVYNAEDHLGYIPKRDVPAVALNMEEGGIKAVVEYIEEDKVDLVVPVTFNKLETMSDDELEGYRFYKKERTKYEGLYVEGGSEITKDEFIAGIKQQRENL